jgi:hypothetical protein
MLTQGLQCFWRLQYNHSKNHGQFMEPMHWMLIHYPSVVSKFFQGCLSSICDGKIIGDVGEM